MENKNRKKILIATGLYPPDVGGPATYSKLLADELPKHGFSVHVLSFGEVRHLPKIVRHIAYFFKVLKRGKYVDIIYAQDPVSVGLPVCVASFFLHKEFLLKVVGDYAWEQFQAKNANRRTQNKFITPDEFQGKIFDFVTELRRRIEQLVARRAKKIIVPSEYLKKIVTQWRVPVANITVIYNAFSVPSCDLSKEEARKKHGISGKIIVSAGRFVPWKGFVGLVNTVKNMPDYKLFIAGDGPYYPYIYNEIKRLDIGNRVFLLGSIRQEQLFEYIKAADVFVLNTGYEGLSHQLLEAMSLGIPVVTTNVCGNPELIKDGKEGILVGYDDIEALQSGIERAFGGNSFTVNAQKKVQKFSKERMISSLKEEIT